MSNSKDMKPKPSPSLRAIFAGLIAGVAAGAVAYTLTGLVGLVIGFIAGLVVGSRTVLLMDKAKEEPQ